MNDPIGHETAGPGGEHWTLDRDADGIATLVLDRKDASANSLSRAVIEQLGTWLAGLERELPKGLVITSGKSGFIAGADVREFQQVRTPEDALPLVRAAHAVLARLEALPCPTVAAINGFCLGGGLELALACRHRVLSDDPKAVLGLPEVMLGIHPGFGGTVRSVRLIGVTAAMDLMLSGRNVRPDKALALGLVDRVVPPGQVREAAAELIRSPRPRRSAPLAQRVLSWSPMRGFVAPKIEAQVARRARREHYPAPYAIVDLWRRHGANPRSGYEAEAQSVARLVCTPTSRNLVRVFFLQERLKSLGGRETQASQHVHVVGAGVMGGDIAAWCVQRGHTVTLQDRTDELIRPALERARAQFEKRARAPAQVSELVGRLTADAVGDGAARADIVIEAIFENEQAKRELYARLEPRMKPTALLATNTSSIMLERLSSVLNDPGRLVGLQFFNPVAVLPLVEVVESRITRIEARAAALAFTRGIDKLPLPCVSAPGFVVNRVLMPYLSEAMLVAQEGVPLVAIDQVAERFGMPMGPIELADTIGLDVCLHVGRILSAAFGRPAPAAIESLVAAGKLGRKSGTGLYAWQDGKPIKPPADGTTAPADVEDRLVLSMVNEAVAILRERVVADEDLVDAGVIFGSGFAPFRGGPLRYARERGVEAVHARLLELEAAHGPRFHPDDGWSTFLLRTV
jgi:3-hydroxyacyl-CoA dehydrogenase/enoyl-CoA hydratase/3-hydroxybutyryl-CoA epimerase